MISAQLEIALHDSFVRAQEKHNKGITVEHLLLQLLGIATIQERLRALGLDDVGLRGELELQLSQAEAFSADEELDTQPTSAFQRTIQQAILRVQKAHRPEVTPLDVLEVVLAHPDCLGADSVVQRRFALLK